MSEIIGALVLNLSNNNFSIRERAILYLSAAFPTLVLEPFIETKLFDIPEGIENSAH